jgi:transcriptional regulator
MYIPKHFLIDDLPSLHDAMHDLASATIVSQGTDGLVATLVPTELVRDAGEHGVIRCHFSRANPHAKAVAEGGEVLAIFQGPQGYISPSWYPSKQTNEGKVVPTWNYLAVHAYGPATTFEGLDALLPHLEALTNRHEGASHKPWAVSDAPDDFIETLARGIIGIEITITRIDGKKKMNQNRPAADRAGMRAGLMAQGRDDLLKLAEE